MAEKADRGLAGAGDSEKLHQKEETEKQPQLPSTLVLPWAGLHHIKPRGDCHHPRVTMGHLGSWAMLGPSVLWLPTS